MNKLILSTLMLLIVIQSTFSIGALYARRALTSDTSQPLWLKKYDATVTITDQIAITHVDQTFKNEDNFRKEGIFIFPLPENAIVTELALWIDGKRVLAQVMEADTARAKYDSIVRKKVDPALLEYLGKNVFKLSVFPIEANGNTMSERRIEITYAELLTYDASVVPYDFFMKTVNLSAKPVERASISIALTSQKKILDIFSPSHGVTPSLSITRLSDYKFNVSYGEENTNSESDFRLSFRLADDQYSINYLTYVPQKDSGMFFDSTGDNPYYLLWITPPESASVAQTLSKNVVFVADISSSMTGTRMEQVRGAMNSMIDMLNIGDKFNIISFATGVTLFQNDVAVYNSKTAEQAHAFINKLGAAGLTNMEGALHAALNSTWDPMSVNGVIFLTDGVPTWPTGTDAGKILEMVKKENTAKVAIHTFGISTDAEIALLKTLARDNSGFSFTIAKNDSIRPILESFMRKISYPLISSISVSGGLLDNYDVFPRSLPDLYLGSQLTLLGRYRNTGTFAIKFSGRLKEDTFAITQDLKFPANTPNHPFVPRMWASAKIDYLLNEIAICGEQKELVDEVKILGKKYSIITPYTSMLVQEPPPPGTGTLVEDKTAGIPKELKLFQNSPNPFKPFTSIRFSIPRLNSPCKVSLRIYDLNGKLVRILLSEETLGGNFMVRWDGRDNHGAILGSGLYFAVLETGNRRLMIRMQLTK